MLTLAAALSLRPPHDQLGAAVGLAACAVTIVGGFSVYPDWLPPSAFAAAAIVAVPASAAVPKGGKRLIAAAALAVGTAFALFALLGPADGLF